MNLSHIYSYTATFEDGTQIVQDHTDENGDVSLTTETGSRFTDVLAKSEESPLVSFVVHNENFSFGVDLTDGHFEINGIGFYQHRPDLNNYKDFRIIYYRTVKHEINQGTGEHTAEIIGYGLGWQVTHNGKNEKRELFF